MVTLTGKITDVTGRAPDSISSITVKAPSARIGGGTDVIVSSPAEVTFDKATGDITISGLTGGLSWLYIEGDGWSDSIALSVAEGMITLVEAVANAAGAPGIVNYISLINNAESAVQDFINGLEADTYGGFQPASVSVDTLLAGGTNSNSRAYYRLASGGNSPDGGAGVLDVTNTGDLFTQTFYSTTNNAIFQRTITDQTHIVPGQWVYGDWERVAFDSDLEMKADKGHKHDSSEITDGSHILGASAMSGRVVKTNAEGKLFLYNGAISEPNDVVNKHYVDSYVDSYVDTRLDHSISSVGDATQAGKIVKLNASGKLHVFDGSIASPNDVVNKRYVDNQTAHSVSSVGDATQAGKHLKLNDQGKVTVWDSTITSPTDVVNKRYVDTRVKPLTSPEPTRAPLSNPGTWSVTEVPSAEYPKTMSRDRTTWWTGGWSTVWQSTDQGETREVLHKFSTSCYEIVEANDGELFAFVGAPRTVYKSVGYPTLGVNATWEPVLTMTNPGASISYTRSFSQHENIVVIGEYTPKYGNNAALGENGRWVWLSLDYGKTFKVIFDLNAFVEPLKGDTVGIHIHGVLWDPYWDRIWVTFGDDVDGIVYSDDLGKTWQTAKYGDTPSAPGQVVGAVAMPNCILFGSDNDDNGVFRIDRAPGKAGPYVLEKAWQFPESGVEMRTHLCHHSSRVQRPGDDGPAIFGFSAEDRPAKSFLVGTYDGTNFTVLWQDDRISDAGKGLKSVVGPTLSGEFILGLNDGPDGRWLEVRGSAGIY